MTRQAAFDVERQIDALTKLRIKSGKGRSRVAVDLGMESDTYRKYENGQTELRVSQIDAFADAYGVPSGTLLRCLGFQVVDPASHIDTVRVAFIMEATTAGMPQDRIERELRGCDGRGRVDQVAWLAAAIETWRNEQMSAQTGATPTKGRARRYG